jgi:polyisoprenoid-binding protein YceI
MKKINNTFKTVVFTLFLMVTGQLAMAQAQYKLDPAQSSVLVKGTSSLHNWEMKAGNVTGSFVLAEDQALETLQSGSVVIDAGSIKSEHNLMDKKAMEALKQKSYPKIEARLLRAEQHAGKVTMELTIAGKTRPVTTDFHFKKLEGGKMEISGVLNLKMSDFGVEPPVAMMGAIKTGNEVNIEYRLTYQR